MKEIIEILRGGILWVILWNLWMCYRQYPYDNTFWKKEIQLYLTGDARPAVL